MYTVCAYNYTWKIILSIKHANISAYLHTWVSRNGTFLTNRPSRAWVHTRSVHTHKHFISRASINLSPSHCTAMTHPQILHTLHQQNYKPLPLHSTYNHPNNTHLSQTPLTSQSSVLVNSKVLKSITTFNSVTHSSATLTLFTFSATASSSSKATFYWYHCK